MRVAPEAMPALYDEGYEEETSRGGGGPPVGRSRRTGPEDPGSVEGKVGGARPPGRDSYRCGTGCGVRGEGVAVAQEQGEPLAEAPGGKSSHSLRGGVPLPCARRVGAGLCGGAAQVSLHSRPAEFSGDPRTARGAREIARNAGFAVMRRPRLRTPSEIRLGRASRSVAESTGHRWRQEHPDRR